MTPPETAAAEAPATADHDASGVPMSAGTGYAEWASQWGSDTPEGSATSWIGLVGLGAAVVAVGVLVSWYLVAAIMAIVLSVILHEAGHFIAAKRSGMKVTEAFVGFGPRIWSFRRGETEYGIKAIWVGAYVKIIGMHNLEEVDGADEDRTYRAKSYPRRLITILAGPLMNIFLCFVLFSGYILAAGTYDDTVWPLKTIVSGSAAERAGLQPGDQLVSVDGTTVATYQDFKDVIPAITDSNVNLTLLRDGQLRSVDLDLGWRLSAAARTAAPELHTGDVVSSIDGVAPTSFGDFRTRLAAPGPHVVQVDRGFYGYEIDFPDARQLPEQSFSPFLGIAPEARPEAAHRSYSVFGAADQAARQMVQLVGLTGQGVARLFSPTGLQNYGTQVSDAAQRKPVTPANVKELGKLPGAPEDAEKPVDQDPERVSSIIGGTKILGDSLELGGLETFALVLGSINLTLGLLNLLPLLPFDGGHATVATYERLRSRKGRPYRVDIAKLMPLTYAVVGLMLLLGLTSMFLDIARPPQLP